MNPERELIAPCGMFCGVCSSYLAYSKQVPKKRGRISHCIGCRPRNKTCSFLKKRCRPLLSWKIRYCFECSTFPCRNLEHIDERYRRNYGMSFIDNLELIRSRGEKALLNALRDRLSCPKCGALKSVHSGKCFGCDEIRSWRD